VRGRLPGHTETVRELLAHGADPDLREDNGTGRSPLDRADNGTRLDTAEVLRAAGARRTPRADPALQAMRPQPSPPPRSKLGEMFTPQGPTLRELTVQALSSIEHGYDLLAPKFDHTPFRTPDAILEAVGKALAPMGPFAAGLDLCCGTGAGMEVLRELCRESVTGVDISTGMLTVGRSRLGGAGSPSPAGGAPSPSVALVRADARALPFGPAFDLVVSFGAFGHFLPRELPGLFSGVHAVLRPGGRFAFPVVAPPRPTSHWPLPLSASGSAS